ncbi:MAG: hypothetical protein LBP89_09080 [Helicobacteraceae bacterium]|nr:hypothetical protein [Helicobacteraceae bacterium]
MAKEGVTSPTTLKGRHVYWLARALNHDFIVSFILALVLAFGVWVFIDYEAYYGGYNRGKMKQINTMHYNFIEQQFQNGKLSDYSLDKSEVSLTIIDNKNSNVVYQYDYTDRADYYERSEITIKSGDHNFIYGYYIKPKLWVGIIRSLSLSILPDCIKSEFTISEWFDKFIGYNFLRSTTFYIPLAIFWFLFYVIIRRIKRYVNELTQTKEIAQEKLKAQELEIENDKKIINEIKNKLEAGNKELSEKENMLAQAQKELDKIEENGVSSNEERNLLIEKAKLEDEITHLKSENESLQTKLKSAEEKLREGEENEKDLKKEVEIKTLIEKFDAEFEKSISRDILHRIAESYYFYNIRHEYMLLILYGWCVGFERIAMEQAKKISLNKQPINTLDAAIDIIARYKNKDDIYKMRLRRVKEIRNQLMHGDTSIITIDVTRELHAKLFGIRTIDGLLYDLATLKTKSKK